jgi:hypothetical protein
MRGGSLHGWFFGIALGLAASASIARAQDTPSAEATPDVIPDVKVAVVVAGDPDPALVEAASQLAAALGATEGLALPADEALRAALVGAPAPAEDDGLDEARAARRRIGLGDAAAQAALARIGGLTGAVALAIVRRAPDPAAEVFDVDRGAYFEGKLDLATADPQAAGRFVLRRARAARAHVGEPVAASAPPPAPAAEAVMPRTAAEAATAATPAETSPGGEPTEARHRAPWIRKNWPYFVAGALLAGAVTFIVLNRNQDQPDPVIRIRPGGS